MLGAVRCVGLENCWMMGAEGLPGEMSRMNCWIKGMGGRVQVWLFEVVGTMYVYV